MKFICNTFGEEHEEMPAIGYKVPFYYHALNDTEKNEIATLTADTCVVKEPENTFRFIRGVLIQKINDACQGLEYGMWVSLSEKSYNDYIENSEKEDHQEVYFGWLNCLLPDYEEEEMDSIKTQVITQGAGLRPIIKLNESQDNKSRFVDDYFSGITKEEAVKRINFALGK